MFYLFLGFLLAVFLITLSLYIITVSPFILLLPRKKNAAYFQEKGIITDPFLIGINYQNISFFTTDGFLLRGWFLKSTESKGLIIYLHGIADSRHEHLEFMKNFIVHGFDVVMYDARAHGESEGHFCTFGAKEKWDVKSAIDFLTKENFIKTDTVIGLMGTSLGGAVTLQSLNLDDRIKFCITEASFSYFPSTLNDYRKKGFFRITYPFRKIIDKRIEKIGGFNLSEVNPKSSLKKFNGRALLVHGKSDQKIYIKYHTELMESAQSAESLILNSDHNDIREIGGIGYINTLIRFADKYTK